MLNGFQLKTYENDKDDVYITLPSNKNLETFNTSVDRINSSIIDGNKSKGKNKSKTNYLNNKLSSERSNEKRKIANILQSFAS